MSNKCICDTPNIRLENTHSNGRDVKMFLLKDSYGYGIMVMENHTVISCFEIEYCPKCGRKLA